MNNQKRITPTKTFSDLVFNDHPNNPDGVQATLGLGNDINISVVSMKDKETQFGGLYGAVTAGTYEVAVFHHDNMLPLSPFDDVLGWQTEGNIDGLMHSLQSDNFADVIAEFHNERNESRKDLGLTNHE